MKKQFLYYIIVGFLMTIISCKKENNSETFSKNQLIGEWVFTKEHFDTIYQTGIEHDTIINYEDQLLIIDNTDTSLTTDLDYNILNSNILLFTPPDSILFDACPIGCYCQYIAIVPYKITELNKDYLTIKYERQSSSENYKFIRTRYYKRNE